MKKGDIFEGVVEYTDFPDRGVVLLPEEENKILIKGVIKGQTIKGRITKKRNGRYEAQLLEVIKKSEIERAIPACPSFGVCGGCSYQTLPYEEQLKVKEEQVKRLLDPVISTDYEYEGIIGSPAEWGVRNKMEFSFGDCFKGGPMSLGMHKKGSFYDIILTNECKIVHEDYNVILKAVYEYFSEVGLSFYHKMMHRGYLRHLLVRRAEKTGEILIGLHTSSDFISEKECEALKMDNLKEFKESPNAFYEVTEEKSKEEIRVLEGLKEKLLGLELTGEVKGILHLINNKVSDDVGAEKMDLLYGREYIMEELLGLRFKITTFSFFQTNSRGAERLYSKVREFVGNQKDKIVYDLYSGTGTIGQIISPVAKKVYGIEIVEEAVAAANENAKLNGLTNTRFIAGDVFKVLDEVEEKPDFIILDPPRDGVSTKALHKVLSYGVEEIIYIACKPTSLARDIPVFEEKGYRVKKVAICDMFPQTGHVETICLMSRIED